MLHEAGSRDLVGELENGVLDVALVILPMHHDILETTPLLREELVLAVPKAHPLAQRRSVSIAELRGVPLVMFRDGYDLRATTVAACRRAGFEPTFALEGGEMDGVLRLTAAGVGVAVVPSLVVERRGPLRAVRIAKPELTRTIGFAHRRDRRLTRAAQEFIATVRALVVAREWLARTPAGLTVLDGAAAPRAAAGGEGSVERVNRDRVGLAAHLSLNQRAQLDTVIAQIAAVAADSTASTLNSFVSDPCATPCSPRRPLRCSRNARVARSRRARHRRYASPRRTERRAPRCARARR